MTLTPAQQREAFLAEVLKRVGPPPMPKKDRRGPDRVGTSTDRRHNNRKEDGRTNNS